mmetsp:Transcript_19703/g.55021  ORF Transcript_19703/g.55021 Transcript_19703/m.55021 type:complete len:611 (-) Transcript_19703:453-2285(-)
MQVDLRQDHSEELFAGPQLHWLANGRDGNPSVPVLHPHEHVEGQVLVDEAIAFCHFLHGQEGILHDTHNGTVALSRNHHAGRKHHQFGFGPCGNGLRNVEIHFVSVEIGIVGRRTTEIQSKGRPVQHLDAVSHDTHLMQGGLSIEQNHVVVAQLAFDDPAGGQQEFRLVLNVPQIDTSSVVADNVLRSGMGGRPVCHQLAQFVDVKGGDPIGDRQVHSHGSRNPDLVNSQVGIGGNDGARRKVDTLSHEVPAQPSLLSLEALLQGLEGTATALRDLGHPPELVVHKGRNVVLQGLLELLDDNVGFSVLNGVAEGNVALDDVDQLVGQIVFRGGSTAHADTGPDVRRRDRQDLDQQPIGSGVGRVEAQDFHVLLLHGLEDLDGLRPAQELLRVATRGAPTGVVVHIFRLQVKADLGEFRLRSLAVLALLDVAQKVVKGVEALSALLDFLGHLHLVVVHRFLDARAMETDASERLKGSVEVPLVVDRSGQFQVPKVPRVALVVEVSQAGIVDSSIDGLTLDLCFVLGDSGRNLARIHRYCLGDRVLAKLVGIHHTELQLFDSSKTDSRVSKILRGHPEGRRSGLFRRHCSSCCCCVLRVLCFCFCVVFECRV